MHWESSVNDIREEKKIDGVYQAFFGPDNAVHGGKKDLSRELKNMGPRAEVYCYGYKTGQFGHVGPF